MERIGSCLRCIVVWWREVFFRSRKENRGFHGSHGLEEDRECGWLLSGISGLSAVKLHGLKVDYPPRIRRDTKRRLEHREGGGHREESRERGMAARRHKRHKRAFADCELDCGQSSGWWRPGLGVQMGAFRRGMIQHGAAEADVSRKDARHAKNSGFLASWRLCVRWDRVTLSTFASPYPLSSWCSNSRK